ncbi:hypothetical protein BT63DRAFT_443672 [Microthyrium microscopicum]|uniref:LysM domain-containing protein n=1 Tax=Microthyrium microscopicum TaxID=703497 RepID=A0A6A6TXS0_9PEZI|nr:hypothetical protein BT63DRAFT_443672 [Microthyrium microscopicum]
MVSNVLSLLATAITFVNAAPLEQDIASTEQSMARRQTDPSFTCKDFSSICAGTVPNLCRPTNCSATYTVLSGDTCSSLKIEAPGVTATQLAKWNPEIGRSCFGLQACVPICINVPGYVFPGQPTAGSLAPASDLPVPLEPGTIASCQTYAYVDDSGDPTGATLLQQNGITKEQFLSWNNGSTTQVDGNIVNWAGYYVCVKA